MLLKNLTKAQLIEEVEKCYRANTNLNAAFLKAHDALEKMKETDMGKAAVELAEVKEELKIAAKERDELETVLDQKNAQTEDEVEEKNVRIAELEEELEVLNTYRALFERLGISERDVRFVIGHADPLTALRGFGVDL